MAQKPEAPDDWEKLYQTRVSVRADELVEAKIKGGGISSRAHYLRSLIYRDIGLPSPPDPATLLSPRRGG